MAAFSPLSCTRGSQRTNAHRTFKDIKVGCAPRLSHRLSSVAARRASPLDSALRVARETTLGHRQLHPDVSHMRRVSPPRVSLYSTLGSLRFTSKALIQDKKNVLTFKPPSETRDRTTPVSDQRDCPPPPPALLTQDSMPRERRHLAGETWEGGSVCAFSLSFSGECSHGAHGLLRFRTDDVLLGTSGVGVCV